MKKNSELDKSDDYTAIWMYLIPFKNGWWQILCVYSTIIKKQK
jgi:hypothetical protein